MLKNNQIIVLQKYLNLLRKYLVKVKTIKHVLHILLLLLSLSLTGEYFKKMSTIFNFNVEKNNSCYFSVISLNTYFTLAASLI